MNTKFELDLDNYLNNKEVAMVGRKEGEAMLASLKDQNVILSTLENNYDEIVIKIPNRIITMNKSFFLGFMETRVQVLGKEKYLKKYKFIATQHITDKIVNIYIDAALLEASPNEILNV